MKEVEMHNGEVRDARPKCPECDRPLARAGDRYACYNCNERYDEGPNGS
jgi:ribosomal protein S27AE